MVIVIMVQAFFGMKINVLLSKSKTKCSLYFGKKVNVIEYIKNLAKDNKSELIYDGEENLGELGTKDNNLRYIGIKS